MKKAYLFLVVTLSIITSISVQAQNLFNGPESVAFDTVENRYLVCNARDGYIVEVDSNGVQSYWGPNLISCLGNVIVGDRLYVASRSGAGPSTVIGLNLQNGAMEWIFQTGGANSLDGLSCDKEGYLYAIDTQINFIYKVNIADNTFSTLVTTGLSPFSQDIFYDERHHRLLVCSYSYNAPLLAVDANTGEITTLVSSTIGSADGITMDPAGNVYLACSRADCVIMYDSNFTQPPTVLADGIEEPAGLDFNWYDSVLAIPSFGGDSVLFISCSDDDGDGVMEMIDNCPSTPNPDQLDPDADQLGNACDNCPDTFNPNQADADLNDIGDLCDGCCGLFTEGYSGNVDCGEDGRRNLADITRLIDRVYVTKAELCCEENGNVDGDTENRINLADITALIDHVYVSRSETASCS